MIERMTFKEGSRWRATAYNVPGVEHGIVSHVAWLKEHAEQRRESDIARLAND